MEVTQIKGDGETHPLLSPDDEFADFETWDVGNILPSQVTPKKPDMLPYEYARSALKLGLALQQTIGANPYQFGMIGSSDSHTSLATAAENNFMGKAVFTEPGVPDPTNVQPRTGAVFLSSKKAGGIDLFSWQQVASGYAAVWATENTREAIFDAMQRKEVYATTGPRITVRLFGGWDFTEADLASPDYIVAGYNKGVPMGGDLGEAQKSKVPGFLITALKDVRGANLDRIQIVKGWRDSQGKLQEKVFNVAVSDNRRIGKDGKVKPLKSTVDGDQYQNTQGAVSLQAFWQDPAFDARNPAFYYARVIEIPKPRWTAYDHSRLGTDLPEGTTKEVQDRAYTSPIWYQPE